jgi:hypothetical protein
MQAKGCVDRPCELLAKRYRVIAPFHPGYGTSALPDWFGSVDISPISISILPPPSGSMKRPWSARASAAGSPPNGGALDRRSRLVLLDPLGIKVGRQRPRHRRHARHAARRFSEAGVADPAKGEVDFTRLPKAAGRDRARTRAFALYGWKPYMHNPAAAALAIALIARPCCRGAEDRITPAWPGLGQEIAGAKLR